MCGRQERRLWPVRGGIRLAAHRFCRFIKLQIDAECCDL